MQFTDDILFSPLCFLLLFFDYSFSISDLPKITLNFFFMKVLATPHPSAFGCHLPPLGKAGRLSGYTKTK